MSRSASGKPQNPKTNLPETEPASPSVEAMEIISRIWARFQRYLWDIVGVALFVIALLTLLALLDLTRGSFISPWGELLRRWTGLGSFAVALMLGYLGIIFLRRRVDQPGTIQLGRILALEGFVFTLMAFLAMLGGLSLEMAEAGKDGGVVGWGLGRGVSLLVPLPLGAILVFLLLLVFGVSGFGLDRFIKKAINNWLTQSVPDDDFVQLPLPEAGKMQPEPSGETRAETGGGIPIPVVSSRRDEYLPPLSLLVPEEANTLDEDRIMAVATKIEKTLAEFSIPSRVVGYRMGPTVTQFAVEPGFVERIGPDGKPQKQKVRVSQISALSRDLALALAAERLRIEAPVPGHSYVGIEVPNSSTALVRLRPILESEAFLRLNSPLSVALGRDVSGQPVVADLARMPHLLVAGTTGSGKSVCLATIITSLVMNNTPATMRLAILDPKMVELVRFNGLPHILGKVETEIERMLGVLRWALVEMDQRYKLLEGANARDLETFNRKLVRRGQEPLPRIVVLIDELADLMMSAPDQTEHSLVRLAQMARAVGIHMVVATQRPSTDVVTGLIKANFPARIAFTVASSVDSRVILDMNGAETLLGRGDMLFLNPESGTPLRSQGVLLKDQEINRVIGFWQRAMAEKAEEQAPWEELLLEEEDGTDDLTNQAIELVRKSQRASASFLQRRLRIGFPRAARLLDELEEMGIVGPSQGGGKDREVLIGPEDDDDGEEPFESDGVRDGDA